MEAVNPSAKGPRTMNASEFRAKCLKLMDEVAESGEEIIITKRGRPVSKLTPFEKKPKRLWGIDKGRINILGDIVSPMPSDWFEESADSRKDLF